MALGDKFLRMGFGLLIGVWVARYLGPEKFGLLNYAIAFVSLFNVFATLGLNNIVVRELVRKPSEKGEILGTSLKSQRTSAECPSNSMKFHGILRNSLKFLEIH